MRLLRPLLLASLTLLPTLTSCALQMQPTTLTPVPTASLVPTSTSTPAPQRQALLRIATLGDAAPPANVWMMFDGIGADYWTYVTQADYWPRLYTLEPLSLDFVPAAAQGFPSALTCDAATCTATVTLRSDLTWSDGSSFTADDVAFTANSVLGFRLGFDWRSAYNPEVLDHVEAVAQDTVKFYFKTPPTITDWQYGALQGPILNSTYWKPRIANAASLLPDETFYQTLQELIIKADDMQAQRDKLYGSLNNMAPTSKTYQETAKEAANIQDELNSVHNKMDKTRTAISEDLSAARTALFALDYADEPSLGLWQFASYRVGQYENTVRLDTPFGQPWFDAVRYQTYPDESLAVDALLNDTTDILLTLDGLSPGAVARLSADPAVTVLRSPTRDARFLTFNHANPNLTDPVLHQALACLLDLDALVDFLDEDAAPLVGFVLNDPWRASDVSLPCAGLTSDARLSEATRLLTNVGYTWDVRPTLGTPGQGMKDPDGNLLPGFTLLTPADDDARVQAADYITARAALLGLSLNVRPVDADTLNYAVYGSGAYDLALLGWRLSVYPAYLCDWFPAGGQNPFAYNGSRLQSACEAWASTTDLDVAYAHVSEIQSVLAQDLPLIPLYQDVRYDAYRNVSFAFQRVLDGLRDLFGAPALAVPIP